MTLTIAVGFITQSDFIYNIKTIPCGFNAVVSVHRVAVIFALVKIIAHRQYYSFPDFLHKFQALVQSLLLIFCIAALTTLEKDGKFLCVCLVCCFV